MLLSGLVSAHVDQRLEPGGHVLHRLLLGTAQMRTDRDGGGVYWLVDAHMEVRWSGFIKLSVVSLCSSWAREGGGAQEEDDITEPGYVGTRAPLPRPSVSCTTSAQTRPVTSELPATAFRATHRQR